MFLVLRANVSFFLFLRYPHAFGSLLADVVAVNEPRCRSCIMFLREMSVRPAMVGWAVIAGSIADHVSGSAFSAGSEAAHLGLRLRVSNGGRTASASLDCAVDETKVSRVTVRARTRA